MLARRIPLSALLRARPTTSKIPSLPARPTAIRITQRQQSTIPVYPNPHSAPPPPPRSRFRRAIAFTLSGVVFITLGAIMGAVADVSMRGEKMRMYTDAETLEMYAPDSEAQQALEARLDAHPLVVSLRADPDMTEARPHLKIPEAMRPHNLTGGTLMGSGRVTVPPVAWGDAAGTRYVQIAHLGPDLCGHPGVVHGGMVATLLDEGLARCCFAALPHKVGMTAYLNIQYKAPTPADAFVVLRATTTKVEGRKAWVEGRLETLPAEGEEPVLLATAEALFVSPKGAAVMAAIYK